MFQYNTIQYKTRKFKVENAYGTAVTSKFVEKRGPDQMNLKFSLKCSQGLWRHHFWWQTVPSTLTTGVLTKWCGRYAGWDCGNKLLTIKYFSRRRATSRSSSLEITERFEIGRIFEIVCIDIAALKVPNLLYNSTVVFKNTTPKPGFESASNLGFEAGKLLGFNRRCILTSDMGMETAVIPR